jgi:CheY-like chemotaxis protein
VLIGCRRRGGALRIEVHDTGPGILEVHHEVIFKEFQRLNAGPSGVQGIGLGLSIVERIGRMMSHPIYLKSRPGAGSVFGMTLPLTEAAAPGAQAAAPSSSVWSQLDGCVVLCVDNEPAILDGMRSLLENWRCTVLQAADSDAAAAAISEAGTRPDMILVDYHLEDETGIACIQTIRRRLGRDIPAILVTADRSPGVEAEARNVGLPLLRKPIKPAALRALMTRLHTSRIAAE